MRMMPPGRMRWHGGISADIFAALLLVVALTGVITRVVQSIEHAAAHAGQGAAQGEGHHDRGGKGDKAGEPLTGACAKAATPRASERPARTLLGDFGHAVKAIHSGEALGPLGTVLSIATGLAMTFFSISGFWMYLQMWRRRRRSRG